MENLVSEKLLASLPSDPSDQLQIARKIVENAWKIRIAALEKEIRVAAHASDSVILLLQSRIGELEARLRECSEKLESALFSKVLENHHWAQFF